MASAQIKFVQGATVGTPGVALVGVPTTPVVVSNGNDFALGIVAWKWTMIDSPPGSAVPRQTVISNGSLATFSFVPDVRGGYHVELVGTDRAGREFTDRRVFQVPEVNGRLVPPFEAEAAALNFDGETRGWSPIMEDFLRSLLFLPDGLVAGDVFYWDGTTLARLPIGTNGQVLKLVSGLPAWVTP